MAVSIEQVTGTTGSTGTSTGTGSAVDIAAGIAGTVANLVVPGSGALVAGVVKAGAPILQSILGVFSREKKMGKSDAAAAAAAAAVAPTAAEIAELRKIAELESSYRKYMAAITPEDLKLSTMVKDAKMSGKPYSLAAIASEALAAGTISGESLGVYKYLYNGTGNSFANLGVGSTGSDTMAAIAAAAADSSEKAKIPGVPDKPNGMKYGNMLALLLAGGSLWVWFVQSLAWEKATAIFKKRQAAAKKARQAKQDQAAAKPAAAKRKPVKRAQ